MPYAIVLKKIYLYGEHYIMADTKKSITITKAVSIRLEVLLKKAKITRYKLEKLTGIPHNTVYNIFKGEATGINLKTIAILLKPLQVTLREFFDDPIFEIDFDV